MAARSMRMRLQPAFQPSLRTVLLQSRSCFPSRSLLPATQLPARAFSPLRWSHSIPKTQPTAPDSPTGSHAMRILLFLSKPFRDVVEDVKQLDTETDGVAKHKSSTGSEIPRMFVGRPQLEDGAWRKEWLFLPQVDGWMLPWRLLLLVSTGTSIWLWSIGSLDPPSWMPDVHGLQQWLFFSDGHWEHGRITPMITHALSHSNLEELMHTIIGMVWVVPVAHEALSSVLKAALVNRAVTALFFTGAAAGAFVWLLDPRRQPETYLTGAGAGLYALLGCITTLHPVAGVMLNRLPPVRVAHALFLLSSWDLYSYFFKSDDGAAHNAHLGGAAYGLLVGLVLRRFMPRRAITASMTRTSSML